MWMFFVEKNEKYQVWRVVRHSADTWESAPPHDTGSCSQPTNPAVAVPACSFSKGDGSNHGQCDQQPGREVAGELPLRLHRTERSKVVEKISPICVTIYRGTLLLQKILSIFVVPPLSSNPHKTENLAVQTPQDIKKSCVVFVPHKMFSQESCCCVNCASKL